GRETFHGLLDQLHGLPSLLDANQGARLDVAGAEHRHVERQVPVRREWMVTPRVDVQPGRARHEAENSMVARGPGRQSPRSLQPIGYQRVAEADLDNLVEVPQRAPYLGDDVQPLRQVHPYSTGAENIAHETMARQALVQPQKPLANPEAVRVRDRK